MTKIFVCLAGNTEGDALLGVKSTLHRAEKLIEAKKSSLSWYADSFWVVECPVDTDKEIPSHGENKFGYVWHEVTKS